MTRIYVDATTLIALGTIGELALLESFDGTLVVLPSIRDEVTTEPAETNLERLCERDSIETTVPDIELDDERAKDVLGEPDVNGDVRIIAAVLAHLEADDHVAIVSDDRRLRTVADGLGATVTGTIGVVVSAVEAGLSEDDAKAVVRRVDEHGLHMTAELQAKADELIEAAAD
ncbi:hypothetical protein CP556_13995 [Natrinema sp. CBA1119]|uniref:hypothetical protein n=1 Tax=Natrinema sp. CBA1119 TaxID=1608465 RepID=UPI000BF81057|nr:hypothetical protein [Natrinema sp. CBA1119]PGF17119.1 hypothetical protein CP556_13995 [Natrinema sp. CBA1119]